MENSSFSYDKCIANDYKASECDDIQIHLQSKDYSYLVNTYMDKKFNLSILYELFNTVAYQDTGETSTITVIGEESFADKGLTKVVI